MTAAVAVVEDAPGVALVESAAPPEPHAFPRLYARLAARDGSCPIESGVIGRLADNECRLHGRLPFDRTPACGCFPQEGHGVVSRHYIEPARVSHFPRGVPAITSEEVDQLLDATEVANGNGNGAHPEAPFGYKADGVTPRKRPYPAWLNDPEKLAAAAKKRSRSNTGHRRARANGSPAISNGEAGVLARTTAQIAAEEQRLALIVRELTAQHEQAAAELKQLSDALAAARSEHRPLAHAVKALAKV